MTDHLKLLTVVLNIALGAAVTVHVWQRSRASSVPFLGPLVAHVALVNVVVWLFFLDRYAALNLRAARAATTGLGDLALVLAYAIYAGMVLAVTRIAAALAGRPISPGLDRAYVLATGVLLAGYGLKWVLPAGPWQRAHFHFYDNAVGAYVVLEVAVLVALWRWSGRERDAAWAPAARAFVMLYVGRYPAIAAIALLPQPLRLFLACLLPNAVPVVWLALWVREPPPPAPEAAAPPAAASAVAATDLASFCREHGLSRREEEVLALVLLGKSNRDIEGALFISYATVKNHVYSIFKKLRVQNRFELARLVDSHVRTPPAG